MLTGFLIGVGVMLLIVLLFAYWWTDGAIFTYLWFFIAYYVIRFFTGRNPLG